MYVVKVSANINIILDLISTFNEFNDVFNRDEKYKIPIRTAMYFIECIEPVIDILKQEENHKWGISLLNAARAYQHIIETEASPADIAIWGEESKKRWQHHLKLKSIGKGKHNARLYDLMEMADFVHYIERCNVKRTKILQGFKNYDEEL